MPYIVGDGGNGSGAELFVPEESGQIIPDFGLLRRGVQGGGGAPVQVAGNAPVAPSINIANMTIALPPSAALENLSDAEMTRVARKFRDAIVKLEGSTR
jgi:hypothetical protein